MPGVWACACAIVARVISPARDIVWWMTRRAPVNYVVDDVACTGILRGG